MNKFVFLFSFCFLNTVFASFYGNQSDVKFKTASTEHFHYYYPAPYTIHAEKVAQVTESVYDSITSRYPNKITSKIHLVLRNALYSNGMAIPAENSMNSWLTNWDFKMRSSHTWLTDVVTHEFAHLVSIENASKIVPSLYGFQISYTDYYNERKRIDFSTLIPFTLQPLWFAEGTAQYESERLGFDSFDTHRDMILRTAILSDSVLPLSYMHDFSSNALKAELGPYNQGFSLVRFIAKKFGDDKIPAIWTELSKIPRLTLSGALEKVIQIDEDSLYNLWLEETKTHYENQKANLGVLEEGVKITTDAFYHDFLNVSGNFLYGISNFGGSYFDGAVFKMPTSLDSITDKKSEEDSLVILNYEGSVSVGDYQDQLFKTKKMWVDKGISVKEFPDGPHLAYVSYQNKDRNGHASFDIFLTDTLGNTKEITHLLDAVYPEIAPDGKYIYFARREYNSTRFILSRALIPEGCKALEYEDIFIPDTSFLYYNIYAPKVSPDNKHIAFGFFDDQVRGIALIDSDGKNFKILSDKNTDARDVSWKDNNTLLFSSDKNGIFNLYAFNILTKEEFPITNVLGGAFNPVYNEGSVFYIGYDNDGFSVYKISPEAFANENEISISEKDKDFLNDSFFRLKLSTPEHLKTVNIPFAEKSHFETLFTKKDSVKEFQNPVILVKDTLLKQEHLKLKGERLQNPNKRAFLTAEIHFVGSEKKYKAIPTIPLFVPLLSLEENAPDFSVNDEGNLHAKLGLAMLLSDPLKKNLLQVGLLFEITNGFDYISSGGINPDKGYDFFALFENRSTPVTFNIGYSYSNLTSKDTVRYEDPRSYGDSIGVNSYAVSLHNVMGSAGYSLFKTGDTLAFHLGYDAANFNLYEDDFEWTYHKRFSAGLEFGIFGNFSEENSSDISGKGNGVLLSYQYSNADLYRSGTFSETFVVNANGTIEPIYRNFNLHEISFSAFGSLENPVHSGARFAFGANITGILNWNSADSDTLDSYYYHPLMLEGYPLLISQEDFNRSGTKTAIFQIHYLFPVYKDLRTRFWIFDIRDFYVDFFMQAGAASASSWFDFDKYTTKGFFDRSIGLEFRFGNILFNSIPFDISLSLAKGLDRIDEDDFGQGGKKMNPIDIPLLPDCVSPTRIHLTISSGFKNLWQND